MTYSVLGIDTQTGQRVEIHKSFRLQGLAITGLQGTGKTVLVKNLSIQDTKQGIGVCVLDLHGDLTHDVLSELPADREKDVIFLDLTEYQYPFGFNLFTCADPSNPEIVSAAGSRVMHIFKKLWGKGGVVVEDAWGVLLEELLWNTTLTFLEASKDTVYTMAEIPLFLTDRAFRNRVVNHLTNRHVKDYWLRKYNLLSEKDQREETRSTLNRVNAFLTQPMVECIVGQARTTIDFRSVMDERKTLLIKLSKRHEAVTALIGSMVIAEFLNAAYSRADLPVQKRKQFHIYVDEAQNYETEDFATLLEEGRKFGIGITLAHQNLGQLEFSLRERTRSVPNLVVFKVNSDDAAALAGEFDITPAPERIEEIEKEELIGHRPVRTYKRDVIGHLLRQGHEDERVMNFVKDYLQELDFGSRRRLREHREEIWHGVYGYPRRGWTEHINETIYPKNHLGVEYDPEMLPPVLAALNNWLFAGMRDRDALWQRLPGPLHWFFSWFYGFESIYNVWYEPVKSWERTTQESAEKRWQAFRAANVLAEEARYSGINRDRLFNAAIAAIETAFADFLSSLFPGLTPAGIREGWRQSELSVPSLTLSLAKDQAARARERITAALLEQTKRQPELDAASYIQLFFVELSKPINAVEVFLPVLAVSFRGGGSYVTSGEYNSWRTVSEVTAAKLTRLNGIASEAVPSPIRSMQKTYLHGLPMTPCYSYHLETFTDNIRLGLIEEMQTYLEPFLTSLRFFAPLHCCQLALYQNPIITTDSGQYEPEKRTMTHIITHPQRSYADMLNKVAAELTNLPLYTARVRMTTEAGRAEHTIRTLDPKEQPDRPLFGQALQARLESIRERNIQDGYLRERAAVEEEIRQRQEQYREPPEEPPISRRPPR